MPKIPRSERSVGLSGSHQPFGDWNAGAPGKALAGLGNAIAGLGDDFAAAAKAEEVKRDDLDMFNANMAYLDFNNAQNQKQAEFDSSITGDGREHLSNRITQFDTDAGDFFSTLPSNEKVRQKFAMQIQRDRGDYGMRSYNVQQNHLQTYYGEQSQRYVTEHVLPNMDGSAQSLDTGFAAVDQMLQASPGMAPAMADKIRTNAARTIYQNWLEKAGPDAAVEAERFLENYHKQAPPPIDVPGEQVKGIAGGPSGEAQGPATVPKGKPQAGLNIGNDAAEAPKSVVSLKSGSAIDVARQYLGATEGKNADTLAAFFRKSGGQKLNPQTTAWCAAFVNAALGASGREGTGSLSARDFLNYGEPTKEPQKGDIVVLWRGSPNSWKGHVGFYDGRNSDGSVRVLGGNQGSRGDVSVRSFAENRVLGFRKPPEAPKGGKWDKYSTEIAEVSPASEARVADASGAVMPVKPRSTRDYFYDMVLSNKSGIAKQALTAERKIETEQKKAAAEDEKAIHREGLEMLYSGKMSNDWIEKNKDRLSNEHYGMFLRSVNPRPTMTDPAVHVDLLERADEEPDDVIEKAGEAYANRQISQTAFDQIYRKAQKAKNETTRLPGWATEQRQVLKRTLRPDKNASKEEIEAYTSTLEAYDAFVDERHGDASKDGPEGKSKSLDRKELTDYTQRLIGESRSRKVLDKRKSLSLPRFTQVGRDTMSYEELQAAIKRTADAYKAGKLSKSELSQEIASLKRWQDLMQAEAASQGKTLKITPPTMPDYGKGLRQSKPAE